MKNNNLFVTWSLLVLMMTSVVNSKSSAEPLFSTDVYKAIGSQQNLVFSPYSIRTCLGLVYMGAEGETASELSQFLHLGSLSKEEVAVSFAKDLSDNGKGKLLKTANKIFLNKKYEVSENFLKLARKAFDSSAETIDFARGTETINDWIKNETNGKIDNLLAPGSIDGDSVVLANAIYFKGEWVHHFGPMNMQKFFSTPNESVLTDFMQNDALIKYGKIDDLDATAVELDYKDEGFSMVLVLPNQKDGFADLVSKIQDNYNLMTISDRLNVSRVDVYIPKFQTEYDLNLNQLLIKMGVETMFTDQANFNNMLKKSALPIQVSKVIHKAMIKVDEHGSEAAAATCKLTFPLKYLKLKFCFFRCGF